MKHPILLCFPLLLILPLLLSGAGASTERPPNIVLIFADDLGYGDLGSYGHPTISTPHLDRLAREGQRWTDFYAAASLCSPSRSALLTGRYPVRSGTQGSVFFEWSSRGLAPEEVTIAEVLKMEGYRTACIGKWHLGHRQGYLPTDQGFDYYYGIPYSNDMRVDPEMPVSDTIQFNQGASLESLRDHQAKVNYWVPLMQDHEVIEYPCDQSTLTQRYTRQCIDFIRRSQGEPFFLYYAQTFPHIPLFASQAFRGTSRRGLYGDTVEEMDASIGAIMQELDRLHLRENTLIIFTSDNGPWKTKKQEGGSAGMLRAGKGTTYEGGMRVPAIFSWPGHIPQDTVTYGIGSTLDLFATLCALTGATPPDTVRDSLDLSATLRSRQPSPRSRFFYYRRDELCAIRDDRWKAFFITEGAYTPSEPRTVHDTPLLYDLWVDPGEEFDVASQHPEVLARMRQLKQAQEAALIPAESQYQFFFAHQEIPEWFRARYAD